MRARRYTRGGIADSADPVEDPAGLCLLFRFVTKKRVLEGYVGIVLIQAHGLPRLQSFRYSISSVLFRFFAESG